MNMKKTQGLASKALLSLSSVAAVGLTLTATTAEAVPAFARQMGMQCQSCHSQAFPALNAMGRAFKASGYTMMGAQAKITGNELSIPAVLNMSVISKLRYEMKTDNEAILWPDEAAFLVGGRVGENIGALAEIAMLAGAPANADTANGATNNMLGYKIVFNVANVGGSRVQVIPFSTDGLGAGYGMELLNTGAQRSQRMIEDRKAFSASQAIGLGSGAATGIAVAITNPMYFVNISQFSPGWWDHNTEASITNLGTYFRAAATPRFGSWDTGFGVQMASGQVTTNKASGAHVVKLDGTVFDVQAEGMVGSLPVNLYFSTGSGKNTPEGADAKSTNFGALVGVMPNKLNVWAAYGNTKKGGSTTDTGSTSVGVNYLTTQNMKLEVFTNMGHASGSKSVTTLQLFTAW